MSQRLNFCCRERLSTIVTLVACGIVGLALFGGEQAFGQSDQEKDKAPSAEQTEEDRARKAKQKRLAARQKASERFMRIRKDGRGRQVALETSVTRYQLMNEDGERVTVDLIGAVHIGEQAYFDQLNEQFEKYDALLYELVAPEGTVIPKGGGQRDAIPTNPIAGLQKTMQAGLGLEFQLEHIDYTKDNFVHADMSPEEFAESMKQNDESLSKYALKAIGQGMAMQSVGRGGDTTGMLMALFSNNKEFRMRRMFAKQMQDMDAAMTVFQGKDGSTIIDHRNAKCMRILERELAKGSKKVAIFYGAGHLPDMERRLMSDFKMKRGGQVWLEAWRLRD